MRRGSKLNLAVAALGEVCVWIALIATVILLHWWPLFVLGVLYVGVCVLPSVLPLEGISEAGVRAARRNAVIGAAVVVSVVLVLLAVKNHAL